MAAVRGRLGSGRPHANWFRGHANSDWQLVPGVHRAYRHGDEVEMCARFRLAAPTRYANCPQPGEFASWLCLMQHFGLPTRLLDWTESPLVAAYFAVSHEGREEGDAAVWCLEPHLLNKVTTGHESLTPLGSRRVTHLLSAAFNDSESPRGTVAVLGQEIDLRMTVQLGAYTIHGHTDALDKHPASSHFLTKFTVPAEARATLREELWLLGVRRSMLFPDIANLAYEIAAEVLQPKNES